MRRWAAWTRSVRWLGLDRNPMRRTLDRIETLIRIGLATAFLFTAPPIAARVGHHVKAVGLHSEHERAARYRVTATLLQDAPAPAPAGRFGVTATEVGVKARWTTQDGSPRTGTVHAPWARRAGSAVTIWIDDTGWPVDPPPRHSQVLDQEISAAALTLAVLALALLAIGGLLRQVLDRLRMAEWEADWSAVEPRWTGRRHC